MARKEAELNSDLWKKAMRSYLEMKNQELALKTYHVERRRQIPKEITKKWAVLEGRRKSWGVVFLLKSLVNRICLLKNVFH